MSEQLLLTGVTKKKLPGGHERPHTLALPGFCPLEMIHSPPN